MEADHAAARPLRIELWDWDANSEPDYIGSCHTKPSQLRALAQGQSGLEIINEHKAKKKGRKYSNSGALYVTHFDVEVQYTFTDYLRAWFRLNLMVAVDFTASNGDAKFANSLHYLNPYQYNPYQ